MDSRKLLGVVAVVVVLACAGWLYHFYSSQAAPGEPVVALKPVACVACKVVYAAEIGIEPAKCTKCGAQELWQAIKCSKPACGTIIPRQRGVPGARIALKCPKCGGIEFGEVGPHDVQP